MECDPKGGEKRKGKRDDRTTSMQSVGDHFKRPFSRYRHLISKKCLPRSSPAPDPTACHVSCLRLPVRLCPSITSSPPALPFQTSPCAGFDDLLKCISAITAWQEMKAHFGSKTGTQRGRGGKRVGERERHEGTDRSSGNSRISVPAVECEPDKSFFFSTTVRPS